MARRLLRGLALHSGEETALTLVHRPGPLAFSQGGREAELEALSVARADQGVMLVGEGLRVDLVEHVLSATAALGIRQDLLIEVEGPEPPLLDGGALAYFDALASLGIPASPPILVVERATVLRRGASVYRFEPGDEVFVGAEVAFDHPLLGKQRASWGGDPAGYREPIAPCRTFGFLRDVEALRARGRALGADPRFVVALTEEGALDASLPLRGEEAAGHKLLDLMGDLALYGGPPRGRLFASRPGHETTHALVQEALASGALRRHRGS